MRICSKCGALMNVRQIVITPNGANIETICPNCKTKDGDVYETTPDFILMEKLGIVGN
jgi:DNA-directed RNA polymerase subunit M/transcription elongation factor TFIIS